MKTSLILETIAALVEARQMLRTGCGSIHEQFHAGTRCQEAASALKIALVTECPEIKIEEDS